MNKILPRRNSTSKLIFKNDFHSTQSNRLSKKYIYTYMPVIDDIYVLLEFVREKKNLYS